MRLGSVPQSCESASHGCPSRRLLVEASVSECSPPCPRYRPLLSLISVLGGPQAAVMAVGVGLWQLAVQRSGAVAVHILSGRRRAQSGTVSRSLQTREGLASCRQNARIWSFTSLRKRARVWRPVDKTPVSFTSLPKTCEGLASCRQNAVTWSFTSLAKRVRVWRPVDKTPLSFTSLHKTCEGLASCRQNAAGVSRLSENVGGFGVL